MKSKKIKEPNQDFAQSITAAALALGVPRQALSAAKTKGAPGFSAKGVELKVVRAWLIDNAGRADKELVELRKEKLKQDTINSKLETERRKIDNQVARRELIAREEISISVKTFHAEIRSALEFNIIQQLPMLVSGKSPAECRVICEKVFDKMMARIFAFEKRNDL